MRLGSPLRHRDRVARTIALAALAFSTHTPKSRAQTVDYGVLEKLFAEPVTTSATGLPQRASEVPTDMEIVTTDDIRRSGAIDIPGLLRHVPGVDVLQWTNDDADVSVRGYDQPFSSRLLVLIDGRQVYADYYGLTPWSALPVQLDAIRQIEIVKGPNSALFGFNAVGGVINIITSSPLYDDVNTATLRVGTQGLAEASVVSTYKLNDRAGIRLEAGGRSNNEFLTDPSPAAAANRRGNDRGSIDVDSLIQLADNIQLGLEASHTRSDVTEMVPTLYGIDFAHYRTDSAKAQLTADTAAGLVQGTAYANWVHADDSSGIAPVSLGLPTGASLLHAEAFELVANNEVTVVQLQDLVKLGPNHTLRLSGEYRRTSVNTTPVEGGRIAYDAAAVAGMWDWKIASSLSLTNALRIDHLQLGRSGLLIANIPFANAYWDHELTQASYNSGVVWSLDDMDTVRITASRGVELPNIEDLGGLMAQITSPGPIGAATGLPTVAPSVVSDYEIGWDRGIAKLNASARLSIFIQDSEDMISNLGSAALLPTGLLFTPANLGDSHAEGIELEIKGQAGPSWRWALSYTPQIVTDHFVSNGFTRSFVVDYQHTTPTHVVNASLGWSGGRWEVDGYVRYESAFYGLAPTGTSPSLVPISGLLSVDGRVACNVADWATIALSGQNLGQSRQRQTAAPPVERRVVGSLAVRF